MAGLPTIPRIEIGPELGRGGHGVVLRGSRDGRPLAVKFPLERGTGSEREGEYRRFLREAVALARVRHPALPAVMEVGRADGRPYLVMELVAGVSLAERLAQGLLSEPEVIRIGLEIGSALGAIHAAGLVHRDVKPQNILFDPESGGVRLVDLGSAVPADRRAEPEGTRAYAAPEMLGGDARVVDGRVDLYALGRVLQEALGSGPGQVTRAGHGPGSAAERSRLGEILSRLVAPDPRARYGSAGRLVADLRLLQGDPGTAPVDAWSPARRLVGRDAEIQHLRAAYADAQRGGAVAVLAGAPGAGKTQLLRSFADGARSAGTVTLLASCHPRDPRAFSAVRQIVDGYLDSIDDLPSVERPRAIARVKKAAGAYGVTLRLLSPAMARVMGDVPHVPGSENAEQAFAEGLAEFLGALLGAVGPAIVVVDDVQWMDAGSQRVLSRAIALARDGKALFVLGARDPADAMPLLSNSSRGPHTRIDLGELSSAHALEIACVYLSVDHLDDETTRLLLRLTDGTPLSVIEVLRTLLDDGVLLPHWGSWRLDAAKLSRMRLPHGATSLLERRIRELDDPVRDVLGACAVVGVAFEDDVGHVAAEVDSTAFESALAEARRAELVERVADRGHQFIHHTVHAALLEGLAAPLLARAHQRIAESLDDARRGGAVTPVTESAEQDRVHARPPPGTPGRGSDVDRLFRIAHHYACGIISQSPERAATALVEAARAAFARFDNGRAVEFLRVAERALSERDRLLPPRERFVLAEALLRLGSLDEALTEFDRVQKEHADPLGQVAALVRIATVHDLRFDTVRAWRSIEEAFTRLGLAPPEETVRYAAGSALSWATRRLPGVRARRSAGEERDRDETLAALYFQAGRVAVSAGRPGRIVVSTLRALAPAERLGESPALAKSYLAYSFVLTVAGLPGVGARYLAQADRIARGIGDPVVISHALQMHAVVAAWGGRVQDAVDAASRCLVEFGRWRELSEFCLMAYTLYEMETVRGRNVEAWKWLELAVHRVNRQEGKAVLHEFLLLGARAALVTLGRVNDEGLLARVESATVVIPKDSGSYPSTFGPRLQRLTERMHLAEEFDALVTEFRSLEQDPGRVHMNVAEYYLHLAHARVNQCLRADDGSLPRLLGLLDDARGDLDAAARIPLLRAHALAVTGYSEWFHGKSEEALASFERAAELAGAENAPWVLYAVHRGRAHVLRGQGNVEAARDQAILAESIALEHGAVFRARWVREEFGLRPRRTSASGSDLSPETASVSLAAADTGLLAPAGRARRQLRALLRISQARAQELDPDHQARLVVDELVQALRAERGFLFLTPRLTGDDGGEAHGELRASTGARLQLVVGRDLTGRDLGALGDHDAPTLERGFLSSADVGLPRACPTGTTPRLSAIAAPLVVDDAPAGVVYLDRSLSEGVFTEGDGEVLLALAGQVAIALELARSLHLRERAQEDTLNARKMDAVARLAGGIAHDLNNMLSSIKYSTASLLLDLPEGEEASPELSTIQASERRAEELTKQLMAFSRGDFGRPELVRVGARLERLLPVFQGVVGPRITVETRQGSDAGVIVGDPGQIDQVLMNLVVNARDASPDGGSIVIETADVVLDEAYRRTHPRVASGRYVRISVQDTGHGMPPDVLQKVFEPYFTTKGDRGTGLGLANVYWIIQHAGGHIEASSTPGAGTRFTIHLPRFEGTALEERGSEQASLRAAGEQRNTVLLVEDDPTAAAHLETSLARLGFRVLTARTPGQAAELLRANVAGVALVVTDVLLSGMNGLELSRELRAFKGSLPVLFVAGDTGGILADRGIAGQRVEFMPRLAPLPLLTRRVRQALEGKIDGAS